MSKASVAHAPAAHFFRPELGPLEPRLQRFTRAIPAGPPTLAYVEQAAQEAALSVDQEAARERELRWAFSISVLADVVAAGATIHRVDSSLQVSWPDWRTKVGHSALRRALIRLRDEQRVPKSAAAPEELPSALAPADLAAIMSEGDFHLASTTDRTPLDNTYLEVFQAAKRYWSMPHRDRDARSRPFVLTVRHHSLPRGAAVGLIEACDGAPNERVKAKLLGLTPESFSDWLASREKPASDLAVLSKRLTAMYGAVLTVKGVDASDRGTIYKRRAELEARARGRSKGRGEVDANKKRLSYLIRFSRGLEAINRLKAGEPPPRGDLEALTRVLRDLQMSRLHLDISLCGALPPFSKALGGKLVAAFMADPRILDICAEPAGSILRSSFDLAALRPLLPSQGAVLITTKGLYPGHSAQYERAVVPSQGGTPPIRLRKAGETQGLTASLISDRSHKLARRLLEAAQSGHLVSTARGSGGSRRNRRIGAAVMLVGLPLAFVEPRIRRPVYALRAASNLADVALLNDAPRWSCLRTSDPDEYGRQAVAAWRDRWGAASTSRLSHLEGPISGLREMFGEGDGD